MHLDPAEIVQRDSQAPISFYFDFLTTIIPIVVIDFQLKY
jgi:hypothetical protein